MLKRLRSIRDCKVIGVPLWVIFLCGFLGVLIDIDHPIAYYIIKSEHGRFLYPPVFLLGCGIFCFVFSRITGLYYKYLLRERNETKGDILLNR